MNKYILIYPDDQYRLERFLNEQSEKGIHAEKINMIRIKFSKDNNLRYYYHVMLPPKRMNSYDKIQTLKKQAEFMLDFNLELISNTPDFVVYRTLEDSDIFTDQEIDNQSNKDILKRVFRDSFLYLFILSTQLITLSLAGVYSLMINSQTQMLAVLIILFSMFTFTRVYRSYKQYKGVVDDKLSWRWTLVNVDPILLLDALAIIYFLIFASPIDFIFYSIPIIFFVVVYALVNYLKIKKNSRVIIYIIAALISAMMFANIIENTTGNLTNTDVLISESMFAKETYYLDSNQKTVLELKFEPTAAFIRNLFFDKQYIKEIPIKGQISSFQTPYESIKYVYWDDEIIITSVLDYSISEYLETIE